ncbi:VOC family protein [Streptomyces sp. CA-111067]|uniref:VOC family protein n=1 Tax=Streptomyces sp. CA-111067 TaxID=3240046 RepID=UPI003D981413
MQKITTFLWFDGKAEEAAEFYTSLFDDSRIVAVHRYGGTDTDTSGAVTVVEYELAGQTYLALDGGSDFTFNEAMSLSVDCADQEEVDRLWSALTADGGQESQCGWLKDKFGVSWQIVPTELMEMMADKDKAKANRAMQAMLGMQKIDIKGIRDAFEG